MALYYTGSELGIDKTEHLPSPIKYLHVRCVFYSATRKKCRGCIQEVSTKLISLFTGDHILVHLERKYTCPSGRAKGVGLKEIYLTMYRIVAIIIHSCISVTLNYGFEIFILPIHSTMLHALLFDA